MRGRIMAWLLGQGETYLCGHEKHSHRVIPEKDSAWVCVASANSDIKIMTEGPSDRPFYVKDVRVYKFYEGFDQALTACCDALRVTEAFIVRKSKDEATARAKLLEAVQKLPQDL